MRFEQSISMLYKSRSDFCSITHIMLEFSKYYWSYSSTFQCTRKSPVHSKFVWNIPVCDFLLVFCRFIRIPLNLSSPCFLLEFSRCVPCTLCIFPVPVCVTGNIQMFIKQLINLSTLNKMKLLMLLLLLLLLLLFCCCC